MNRRKKSLKKVTKYRGGFTPSSFTPKSKAAAARAISKTTRSFVSSRAKGRSALEAAAEAAAVLAKPLAAKVGAEIVGSAVAASKWSSSIGNQGAVTTTSESTKMVTGSRGISTGKKYTTSFAAGAPVSRTLLAKEKMSGASRFVWKSSIDTYSITEDPPSASNHRDEFSNTTGWNRKLQKMFTLDWGAWRAKDVVGFYTPLATFAQNKDQEQIIYGDVHYLGQKYTITNCSNYLPVYVKLTLVALHKPHDQTLQENFSDMKNDSLTASKSGAMPLYTQLTTGATGDVSSAISVDPRSTGVFASNVFKERFKKAKSFTKKLSVGDIWEFDYKHFMGSGVRLDALLGDNSGSNDPVTYQIIIDAWGPQVDLVRYDSTETAQTRRAVGSGPAHIAYEIDKYAKIGLQSDEMEMAGSNNGIESTDYGYRLFQKGRKEDNLTRVSSVGYSNIKTNPTATGDYFIPVTTDATITNAGG